MHKHKRCDSCTNRANVIVHEPVQKTVCYECYNRIQKESRSIRAEAIYKAYR